MHLLTGYVFLVHHFVQQVDETVIVSVQMPQKCVVVCHAVLVVYRLLLFLRLPCLFLRVLNSLGGLLLGRGLQILTLLLIPIIVELIGCPNPSIQIA